MACTADELQRLCEALKEEPLLWQVLVRLLIDSGMRVGECVGLLWSNVDFDKNRITVDGTMVYTPDKGVFRDLTKNGKSRTFGVAPEVMAMLKVLKDKQSLAKESEYVFTNESTGLPLHPDSPRRFLKKLGDKCGIEGLHPHLLRHSFTSVAITNGADIASVSEKLGPSDKAVKDSCELKIENGNLAWQFVSGSEKGNNLSAKIDDYFITDGDVSGVHAVEAGTAEGQMGVTVKKTDSGVKVASENSDDAAKYGGAYLFIYGAAVFSHGSVERTGYIRPEPYRCRRNHFRRSGAFSAGWRLC